MKLMIQIFCHSKSLGSFSEKLQALVMPTTEKHSLKRHQKPNRGHGATDWMTRDKVHRVSKGPRTFL